MKIASILLFFATLSVAVSAFAETVTILNVSYDVTREFYRDYNIAFATKWKADHGQDIEINQSHGGSSKQARAVIGGLEADVVTMNQSTDIDAIARAGRLSPEWISKFPNNSSPFTSTIVFLVRKGNPKSIRDWPDLVKPGVQVIIPNPKTSGNGRYSYMAAWGAALRAESGTTDSAKTFMKELFANAPALDTGSRAATSSFAQRGIGDVLLTFENEAHLARRQLGEGEFEIVIPPVSILVESPVAVVDSIVDRRGTRIPAEGYLTYLYSPEAQELAATHHFRPRNEAVLARHAADFPPVKLLTIGEIAGSWAEAQKTHFEDGGVFDAIYRKR